MQILKSICHSKYQTFEILLIREEYGGYQLVYQIPGLHSGHRKASGTEPMLVSQTKVLYFS